MITFLLLAFLVNDSESGKITFLSSTSLLAESFESMDMSNSNIDGFSWNSNNRTSVVTQDPVDGPVVVYNNGVINNIAAPNLPDGSVRDWSAKSGDYSLRFRYPAGQN